MESSNRIILITVISWLLIIASLFLHTSGIIKIPFFNLKQSKGAIVVVEENYKGFNLVAIKEEVYAIPHGIPLSNPRRMKRQGTFEAHSKEEAKRMIDANKEDIEPRLYLVENNFRGFNIYRLGNRYYIVRAMHKEHAVPLPTKYPYHERYAGSNIENARGFVTKLKESEF
ncbi:MAG: hypothetical protein A3F16_00475 [Deltaproteobacteria bacterium RIFCSPHIGHO2_12_FULL_43_9]|nr:MAG: hypothetical protein A3F16_00475 [Deltaproteobacteria bacterium RIFCSPHIGHO2_12_FULL_43_9]